MRHDRNLQDWANDSSLFHRLRDCAIELARGKGSWKDRAVYVFDRLGPIREADFPAWMRPSFAHIPTLRATFTQPVAHTVISTAGSMPPKARRLLADSVFNLYEEMLKERVRQGLE